MQSEDPSRSLYLSVWGVPGKNQTMTVEGGGTNATVVIADIVARDGVIHVIDKLLGVPYRSVGEKLAVDAMTRSDAPPPSWRGRTGKGAVLWNVARVRALAASSDNILFYRFYQRCPDESDRQIRTTFIIADGRKFSNMS